MLTMKCLLNIGKLAYFTILRNPLDRYVSEWLQLRRKGNWMNSTLRCRGKPISSTGYQPCLFLKNTRNLNLTLTEFVNCSNALSNNRQTRMLASLDDLGCYFHLPDWTRPAHSHLTFSDLTPYQVDLITSAVENLATMFVTFGLVEHMTYTQYMYRVDMGPIFRKIFTNLENSSSAKQSYAQPGLLTANYENLVMSRNRIDELFLKAAQNIFSNRPAIRLRAESILPRRLRFQLLNVEPSRLLNDHDLEMKICRFLQRFFKLEVRKNETMSITRSVHSTMISLSLFVIYLSIL